MSGASQQKFCYCVILPFLRPKSEQLFVTNLSQQIQQQSKHLGHLFIIIILWGSICEMMTV